MLCTGDSSRNKEDKEYIAMKVIINGRFLIHRVTGVERYAREILSELDKIIEPDSIEMAVPPEVEDIPTYKNINYAYFPVVFDGYKYTRNEVYEMLSEQGITARKYFYPLTNSFECYRNYPTAGTEKTPVAQHLALRVLTLPLYADLALEDVDRICDIILG